MTPPDETTVVFGAVADVVFGPVPVTLRVYVAALAGVVTVALPVVPAVLNPLIVADTLPDCQRALMPVGLVPVYVKLNVNVLLVEPVLGIEVIVIVLLVETTVVLLAVAVPVLLPVPVMCNV